MTGSKRLCAATLERLPSEVLRPSYPPQAAAIGVIHLGVGNFFRAHQAAYLDEAMDAGAVGWGICGVSLRNPATRDALSPQDGYYSLIERDADGDRIRIVGALRELLVAQEDPARVVARIAAPGTRWVTLTITEKGYGHVAGGDRATLDVEHPDIAHDLARPQAPRSAVGLLHAAIRMRRQHRATPLTILSCDNLTCNGDLLRALVLQFDEATGGGQAAWIDEHLRFPNTMIDRIVPRTGSAQRQFTADRLGVEDAWPVVTERFRQWVIEDRFAAGRPDWEAGGAILVDDVEPYELMKLRMLNGSHSMLAYAGFLAGMAYVRDAMADAVLARLVRRHLAAAASTLRPVAGIDLDDYTEALCRRFANPAIAHETYQIAMDGTEKLPQRLLLPALETLEAGGDIRPFAFAVAAWMRYCLGRRENGSTYALRDPREARIAAIVARDGGHPSALASSLMAIDGLFPDRLRADADWKATVVGILARMCEQGMAAALSDEVGPPVAGGG